MPRAQHHQSIPTVQSLRLQQRRADRKRATVAHVLARMQRGESLHLSFEHGHSVWRTSAGVRVAEDVARVVAGHPNVTGVGDALLNGSRRPGAGSKTERRSKHV